MIVDVGFEKMESDCRGKLEEIKKEIQSSVNELEALVELTTESQKEEENKLEDLESSFVQQRLTVSDIVEKFARNLEDKVRTPLAIVFFWNFTEILAHKT